MEILQEREALMGRYAWIDTWRGLAVVHMVVYHVLWDMVYLFGWDIPWFETDAAFYWEQWIAWSFIFISGFCAVGSRRLFRRGMEIFAMSLGITAATSLLGGDAVIWFGILSLLGASMMIGAAGRRWLTACPSGAGVLGMACLFFSFYTLPRGFLQLGPVDVGLPESWYSGMVSTFLGLKDPDFYSADYFPLIPWLFLFLMGYMAGRWIRERALSVPMFERELVFSHIGRRALSVYLLHQPVAYGILLMLSGRIQFFDR